MGENRSIENVREAVSSRGLDIQGKLQSGTGVNCRIARLCLSVYLFLSARCVFLRRWDLFSATRRIGLCLVSVLQISTVGGCFEALV